MNHVNQEQLQNYISNELHDKKRVEIEDHIYSCDLCLESYINQIEHSDNLPPVFANSEEFTKQTLSKIVASQKSSDSKSKKKIVRTRKTWYQHTLVHYGFAASFTLILMTSGVFQSISGIPSTVEAAPLKQEERSISKNLMDRALSWIEVLNRIKEGEEE
jgi:hypothetical protein